MCYIGSMSFWAWSLFFGENKMNERYRVKKDAVNNIWYVQLRTMWRAGKLDWVIDSQHGSHKEALEALKLKEK